jgi:serine/threonine-protein kinase
MPHGTPDGLLQAEVQAALGGQYRLERERPRGGMSRGFIATEKALRRRVVNKVLALELAAGLSAERFTREIARAARLQSPPARVGRALSARGRPTVSASAPAR